MNMNASRMDCMTPDKKPKPYASIATSLLGLTLLSLLCMFFLTASMMTMPGDGATPWLREKTWILAFLVTLTPLLLISAAGFAIAGIRTRRNLLANQTICGLCLLVAYLVVNFYFTG